MAHEVRCDRCKRLIKTATSTYNQLEVCFTSHLPTTDGETVRTVFRLQRDLCTGCVRMIKRVLLKEFEKENA